MSALSGCNANLVVRCGRPIFDQVAGCRELGGAVRAGATTNKARGSPLTDRQRQKQWRELLLAGWRK
jgi:hypothetical protein